VPLTFIWPFYSGQESFIVYVTHYAFHREEINSITLWKMLPTQAALPPLMWQKEWSRCAVVSSSVSTCAVVSFGWMFVLDKQKVSPSLFWHLSHTLMVSSCQHAAFPSIH
jgi:hypothetical protein